MSSAADRARRAGTLVTPALGMRPHRPPDFAAESESMHRLAEALISSGSAMLQTLSDMALNLCDAGSAGIGLLERDAGGAPPSSAGSPFRANASLTLTPRLRVRTARAA